MPRTIGRLGALALICGGACFAQGARNQPPKDKLADACLEKGKRVARALGAYAEEHHSHYPILPTPTAYRKAIQPYLPMERHLCPRTKKAFVVNPELSGKTALDFRSDNPVKPYEKLKNTWMVREATPHSDGTYLVGYLDGHFVRVKNPPGGPAKPSPGSASGKHPPAPSRKRAH